MAATPSALLPLRWPQSLVHVLDYPQLRRTRAPISIGARADFAAAGAAAARGQAIRSNLLSKASGMKRVRDA